MKQKKTSKQETSEPAADFGHLVPDVMLDAVEQALGDRMTGLATPLPSYVNRVYEVQTMDRTRLIAKFYRPGRWSPAALEEEHAFLADCHADEIPVVCPITLPSGKTIHEANGIFFALFPKRLGRQFELHSRTHWLRLGRLLGRVHVAGSRRAASHRTRMHPTHSTREHVNYLLDNQLVAPRQIAEFKNLTSQLLADIAPLFDDTESIRIHGDCHGGNILHRPGEGLMMIDFDDMAMGPPVQDLWMLLPGRVNECREEIEIFQRGYELFREFDDFSLRLIEPLRAMRMLHYLAWCARQVNDLRFREENPNWGSESFWQRELVDLRSQREIILAATT